jgi:predicted alpha/beta superfamily hydrolase
MRDMGETLRETFSRVFRLENRRKAPRPGTLEKLTVGDRMVTIYLPAGYHDRPDADRRYPVLYMQDGQNLFDAERAFGGNPWKLDAAADQVIGERRAQPMIIVGVDHADAGRIDEYTPTHDETRNAGGGADRYAELLLNAVKPAIEERYRTNGTSMIGGSSLGGLISLYLAMHRPDAFAGAAVMSPSVWWHNRSVLQLVEAFEGNRPKLWVDIGAREGGEAIGGVRALRDILLKKGWTNAELYYEEDKKADHSERAWSKRAPRMLEFLFPPV